MNGVPTCLDDKAQNGFLRNQLGYKGLIVSDCDAVGDAFSSHHYSSSPAEATASGIKAGCDQDCGSTYKQANLATALASGNLTIDDIDIALGRIMTMRFNLGMFDQAASVPYTKIGNDVLNNARGQALALAAARESIVLLQNKDYQLPLNLAALKGKTLAIIGPTANNSAVLMGGKSDYCPEHSVSLWEGLNDFAEKWGFTVITSSGSGPDGDDLISESELARTVQAADFVFLAVGGVLGQEGRDRVNITLPDPQPSLVESTIASCAAASKPLALVLVNGEPVAIDAYVDRIDTIVEAFEGGQAGGTAFADIVFGEVAPSGVMPFTTYPATFVDQIAMDNYDMRAGPGLTYRFYKEKATFPFGHGESYVNWKQKWGPLSTMPAATQSATTLRGEGIVFPVVVTNTGLPAGATYAGRFTGAAKVVQLFLKITKGHDGIPPLKTLVAMEKVWVERGQSAHVSLNTSAIAGTCAFCVVSATGESSISPGNEYTVEIGVAGGDPYTISVH